MTFEEWYEENVKYMHPADFKAWMSTAWDAGAAHERDNLEVQFKKMQELYEIRESQPNKPCCLAEREECAKVCESDELRYECSDECAAAIRARSEQ